MCVIRVCVSVCAFHWFCIIFKLIKIYNCIVHYLDSAGQSILIITNINISWNHLGHHATTCKRGGDVVFRHKLRDILAETCRRAHFSVQVEAGCNLTSDHSHSRPAVFSSPTGFWAKLQPVTYQLHHR